MKDQYKTYDIYFICSGTEYEFMVVCKDDDGDSLFSKSVRVWTKNAEGETERFRGPFPPVGYPRNVTVYPTDNGLIISWLPPEYGLEYLKWYIIRWSQGPDEYIFGSADTTNTSYLSKYAVHTINFHFSFSSFL